MLTDLKGNFSLFAVALSFQLKPIGFSVVWFHLGKFLSARWADLQMSPVTRAVWA